MRSLLYISILLCLANCRDRYEYIADAPDRGLLVVDGLVNTNGNTTIRLSRTTPLSATGTVPENGAVVHIEGEDGSAYALTPQDSGRYFTPPLAFDAQKKYRIRITTEDNSEYSSDFRQPIETQNIDSISYRIENDGVQFFANSTSNSAQKYFFKYELEETWEINSSFRTLLKFVVTGPDDNKQVAVDFNDPINHTVNDSIYTCWQSRMATTINIGTTELLTESRIFLPVTFLKRNTIELGVMYSLLVKQNALSAEGYDFFRRMKKNTESLGSVFDAQPSDISGNIECLTNPGETVVGFVEFSSLKESRIFVRSQDLPGTPYDAGCELYKGEESPYAYPFENDPAVLKFVYDSLDVLPTSYLEPMPGQFLFFMEKTECVDCTLQGTNTKPSFWP